MKEQNLRGYYVIVRNFEQWDGERWVPYGKGRKYHSQHVALDICKRLANARVVIGLILKDRKTS